MSRVLVLAGYAPSLVLFRRELLERFVADGHEVLACAADADPATLVTLQEMGVRFAPVPLRRAGLNPLDDLRYMDAVTRLARDFRPDMSLAYTIKPVIFGTLAAARAGVPRRFAMVTGLGTTFQGSGARARLLNAVARRLYRTALARCERVFFQNRDDRELFTSGGLVPAERTILIPGSGINLERFPAAPLPEGPPRFLMIARLIAEKGVREYAAAARIVKERHPDVACDLVGYLEDHPRAIRAEELDQWQREGVLTFHGKQDDVRPALRACTVYVLPSYREGMPRTVLEAMATGRACITTDAPGCRDAVADGETGLLVPVGDVEALAAAMMRLAADPALVAAMSRAARRRAEERFDVHGVVETIVGTMDL